MPLLNAPFRFMAVLAMCALGPSLAHAACASPTGDEGTQVYNSTFKVMQFCNGTNWISMAGTNVSGAWAPSGTALYYSGGNVGIGTNNPARTLQLQASVPIIRLQDSDASGASVATFLEFTGSDGVSTGYIGDATSSNSNIYLLSYSGSVIVNASGNSCSYTSGASWSCSSDKRLKEQIKPLEGSLEKIVALQGVSYHWRDTKKNRDKHIGLIAQDVEKVFPELVSENEEDGMKTLDYSALISPLIESVKSLKAANDNLITDIREMREAFKAQQGEIEVLKKALSK